MLPHCQNMLNIHLAQDKLLQPEWSGNQSILPRQAGLGVDETKFLVG